MHDKKIILVFPFNLLSHYLRCLVLVNQYFNTDRYKILFLSSTDYNIFVQQNGYGIFNCGQFDSKAVIEYAEHFDFSWLNENDINRILSAQVRVMKGMPVKIIAGHKYSHLL